MNENDIKLDKVKYFWSQLYLLLLERERTIIFLVQLIIALMVIVTFTDKIISSEFISSIKFLIVILFYTIPIMMWDYILRLNEDINSLEKVIKNERKENLDKYKNSTFDSIIASSIYYYVFIVHFILNFVG